MFPLPPKKDPKAIVAAFLQSVSNKPALPQVVARAAPQIVRPPAPAVRGGNNLDALTLGGGALGAGLGGLAVSALGGPVGLGLGIGGALGVAAPQIYDYFTRPSGAPPPTLPQSILNKPSSAPQYNIGVNRSQTYREGGVFGPQPPVNIPRPPQPSQGKPPIYKAPPTDGRFAPQPAPLPPISMPDKLPPRPAGPDKLPPYVKKELNKKPTLDSFIPRYIRKAKIV